MAQIVPDRDTLTDLWRTWNPKVVRFLASRGSAWPEDLASEVWLDVARGLASFDGDERAWTKWLFTIARRRLIDEARARKRRPDTVGGLETNTHGPDLAGWTDNPEAVVVAHAGVGQAISFIRRLPDDQAEVILLRVVAGLDVTEVAEVLDKKPGTVRVLAHRGLRRLAELVPPTERTPSELDDLQRTKFL